MGLTISQWDALDEFDRAHALALALVDMQEEARACPSCGGDPDECQNPDNQHAFIAEPRRCYRTEARLKAERTRAADLDGVLWSVRLDPTRKKSARKG